MAQLFDENITSTALFVNDIRFFRTSRFVEIIEEHGEGVVEIEWCRCKKLHMASGVQYEVGAILLTPSSRTVISVSGESLSYSGAGSDFPKDLED